MIHAHVGGVDLCAHAFLLAAKLIEEGRYEKVIADRYAGWKAPGPQDMLNGKLSLEEIADWTESKGLDPQPRSGRQEQIENLLVRRLQ